MGAEPRVPKKSSMELLELTGGLEEYSSEEEQYYDSDMDQGDPSDDGERSRRSESSEEEEDTVYINPSRASTFIPSKEQNEMWHYYLKKGEEHGP